VVVAHHPEEQQVAQEQDAGIHEEVPAKAVESDRQERLGLESLI
jgi:hypothetical protein